MPVYFIRFIQKINAFNPNDQKEQEIFWKELLHKGGLSMKHDAADKIFFDNDERYADLINGLLCNGKSVIKKEDLREYSGSVQVKTAESTTARVKSVQGYKRREKIQDIVRKAALGVNFILIGLENQQTIDYSLPLRCMEYEAGQYEKQAEKIRRTVRKHPKGLKSGEYLYGFRKSSRLYPSIIIVLYYGEEEWDGPVDLHGILDFTDIPEEFRKLVQNYQIHLVEVRKLDHTDVFKTDVKLVFDLIRYSNDKIKLWDMVNADPRYQELEEDAYEMAAVHTGLTEEMKMKVYEEKKVNLCKGLRDLIEDGKIAGKSEGKSEGKLEQARFTAIRMAQKGSSIEDIADMVDFDIETVKNWLKEMVN